MTIEMTAEGWSPDRLTHEETESSMSNEKHNAKEEATRHLCEFAEWLEAHPTATGHLTSTGIYDYQYNRDLFVERARALDAGQWDQEISNENFMLIRKWGALSYKLYAPRECVCEERPVDVPTTEWVLAPSVLDELSASERMDRIGVPEVVS